jgi:hypothetical protein
MEKCVFVCPSFTHYQESSPLKYEEVRPGKDCSILYETKPRHVSRVIIPEHGQRRRGQFQEPRMEKEQISHVMEEAMGMEPV